MLIVALATALAVSCGGGGRLQGTDLGATPAPDFALHDGAGAPFSLRDYRGQAVLLLFLYTHCPDICPVLAGEVPLIAKRLGSMAGKVAFIAVSVDPAGDTPASVAQFSTEHGLDALGPHWRYGIGSEQELAAVWQEYGIGAQPLPAALSAARTGSDLPAISHNSEMYMLDARGRERVLVHPDDSVDTLAHNLRLLAKP